MEALTSKKEIAQERLKRMQELAIQKGIGGILIGQYDIICGIKRNRLTIRVAAAIFTIIFFLTFLIMACVAIECLLSVRCLVPINHLVWEATRPLADCSYCANVTKPIILQNITRQSFENYAYSSNPIIIKDAIKDWNTSGELTFYMFKELYEEISGSYDSFEEGCQFLNFKSNLFSLKEVFEMSDARVRNEPGEEPWYVGWGNCHPAVLEKVRKYYSIPDFLPEDAEFPATENIFLGYEMGAVMHLDYIPRLMWQGQVSGNKTWMVAPVLECEDVCYEFQYYVEPGDIVLLDTRLWYHATKIPKGEFSVTVQSEYG